MKIQILTDNRSQKRGMLSENGLSLLIEYKGLNILFDTGQTDVFVKNAANIGVDLDKTDLIILSHGHYDHCGGLIHFKKNNFPKVYVSKAAFTKRYALNIGRTYRDIGIPWCLDDYDYIKRNIVYADAYIKLAPDIFLLSEIPCSAPFEELSKAFYMQNGEKKTVDTMEDEQMLIFDTEDGLVIFLGCAHPGIVSCLNYAINKFPNRKINTLVAGMHLKDLDGSRIKKTIQSFQDLDIQRVIPLHCTGIFAICEIKKALRERCQVLCAGDTLTL